MIRGEWCKETIHQLRSFSRSSSEYFASATATFIWYHIFISVNEKADRHEHTAANLSTCVALYQDPALPDDDPELFGCVFA
ncbi:hypothetical protein NL351_29020, partial [Klebsiella pneumoniae]|nr:hypothetical protein [Klebsiella pneumoniae]